MMLQDPGKPFALCGLDHVHQYLHDSVIQPPRETAQADFGGILQVMDPDSGQIVRKWFVAMTPERHR